jgi:phage N-6-adenine-methyltransferase
MSRKLPAQKPGKSEQSVGTPWEFIHAVERRFGKLTIDLAADAENAKSDSFIDEQIDSLKAEWKMPAEPLRAWLNPPFADIGPWAAKCEFQKELLDEHDSIFLLVPASVGSHWYWDSVAGAADVYALSPRIKFIGHPTAYPKDLILAHFTKHSGGVFKRWQWRGL